MINNKVLKNSFIISTIIVITLITSLITSSQAYAVSDFTSDDNMSSIEWEYIVTDKDGNIKETGKFPGNPTGIAPNYVWRGITLENAETATFKPAGKKGLKAEKGTTIQSEWKINRKASYRVRVDGINHGYKEDNGFREKEKSTWVVRRFIAKYTDYFVGKLTNLSSDSITINSFSIYFE